MKQRPAAVLLISLLLMSSIVAATIGISVLITADFQQTRSVQEYVGATLAADAGIERGLAVISAGRSSGDTYDDTRSRAGTGTINMTSSNERYAVTSVAATLPSSMTILRGDTIGFDIMKNTVLPIRVSLHSACTGGGLEMSWTLINNQGSSEYQGRVYFNCSQISASTLSKNLQTIYQVGQNQAAVLSDWSNIIGYRVKLRAIGGDFSQLEVIPYDNSNNPVTTFSSISLTSVGESATSRAVKQAQVIWQSPSSGAFNYVLFTEGDIQPAD